MEPKKIPPADLSKAVFPPPTPDKEEKPVAKRDSFLSVAKDLHIDVWDLIEFNFPGSRNKPDIVNWYLYNRMGCREMTGDRKNYTFSDGMKVYFPKKKASPPSTTPAPGVGTPPPATHPFRQGWTAASVADFHAFVAATGLSWANSFATTFDCANFAIHLLLQFAQARYLPVAFEYVHGILRCEVESIVSFGQFAKDVKSKVGAPDLYNKSFPMTLALANVGMTQPGDLLSLPGHHVMVVFKNPSTIEVPIIGNRMVIEILQGNLFSLAIPGLEKPRQLDTRVQHRAYDLVARQGYQNEGSGWEYREDNTNLQDLIASGTTPKQWNFSWFNQMYGMPPL